MEIIKRNSPNINKGRQGWKPDIIVCHITEGSFDGAVSWLSNPVSQVSSHFVVGQDGQIVQLVSIEDTAWMNGTTTADGSRCNKYSKVAAVCERNVNANLFTIGIEHEGRTAETGGALTPAQQAATIRLITFIREEVRRIYGIDIPIDRQHIVGHSDIVPQWKPDCPGSKFQFDEIIAALKGGVTSPPAQTIPNTSCPAGNVNNLNPPSDWARTAWEWAVSKGITDGTNPQAAPTREQVVQLLYNFERAIWEK